MVRKLLSLTFIFSILTSSIFSAQVDPINAFERNIDNHYLETICASTLGMSYCFAQAYVNYLFNDNYSIYAAGGTLCALAGLSKICGPYLAYKLRRLRDNGNDDVFDYENDDLEQGGGPNGEQNHDEPAN